MLDSTVKSFLKRQKTYFQDMAWLGKLFHYLRLHADKTMNLLMNQTSQARILAQHNRKLRVEAQWAPDGEQMVGRRMHRPQSSGTGSAPLSQRLRVALSFPAQPRLQHWVFKFETCFFSRPNLWTGSGRRQGRTPANHASEAFQPCPEDDDGKPCGQPANGPAAPRRPRP